MLLSTTDDRKKMTNSNEFLFDLNSVPLGKRYDDEAVQRAFEHLICDFATHIVPNEDGEYILQYIKKAREYINGTHSQIAFEVAIDDAQDDLDQTDEIDHTYWAKAAALKSMKFANVYLGGSPVNRSRSIECACHALNAVNINYVEKELAWQKKKLEIFKVEYMKL